ncbi:MAG: transcriptional regulator NrdR [Patescibacteria group bacterium]|nr:transcriptional regulator NrdR [Patescibacteria group bacterium]
MKCPYCQSAETKVIDKRDLSEEASTRRRRECLKCGKRFTTYEKVERIDLKVVKKDGRVEDYVREKLKAGLVKAVEKRPVTEEQIEEVIDDIEQRILKRQSKQISASDIGQMVLTRLKKIDRVAYLRFASVFLEFESLKDFAKQIKDFSK